MNTQKILNSEINSCSVASLPNRPASSKEYGGLGLTAQEMKAAFDRLPLLGITRLNSLIDDIEGEGVGRIGESIKTGLYSGHTLANFFSDLNNGTLASYLAVGNSTLIEKIATLEETISALSEKAVNLEARISALEEKRQE
jgi:hypothetical protein